jgi:CO/xanthine dehydrogenase Mo-binding subunit
MQLTGTTASEVFADPETRVEGREKVTGRMEYTADLRRPNMLWAAFATSPYAHARIVRIDTTAARAVAGVRAVLTGEDIGRRRFGRQLHDMPVLAFDRVLLIGDRVAAVAAETREAAEEAARRIDVEYEELEPLLDPARALDDDAPLLHPERRAYFHAAFAGKDPFPVPHENVQGWIRFQRGERDLDPIFAAAHRVYEHRFSTPRQHAGYIEPRSTLVWIDGDETIHVQSPNKMPFALRGWMAQSLGIPRERIVVEPSAIGGDFGGKGTTIDELPCYFLARATGRPVRYVETYTEELRIAPTRHAATISLKTAVDHDGRFLAHVSDVLYDGGAYAGAKVLPWLTPGLGYSAVPYFVPNSLVNVTAVYTNSPPGAHVRAPVDVQVFFGWEQHVDVIARDLGIDAIDLRMLNALRDGQTALTDEVVPESNATRVLDALRRESRYGEPLAPGRGRGIALTCRPTHGNVTSVRIVLHASGRIEVVSGVTEQGAGQLTMLQRVAAATLGVNLARIDVRRVNTAESPADAGTGGSWVTRIHGRALFDASTKLKALLEEHSGLTLADDAFVGAGGERVAFEAVAAAVCVNGDVSAEGSYAPNGPDDFSFCAFAIEADVDAATGAVRVTDAIVVCDVAAIINPIGHQGQIDGGFAAGIGSALMEEITIDESGKVGTLSLGEYKLPTMRDMPPLRTVLVRARDAQGPYGTKMAGELSNSGVAPAIANAVFDAVGVRLDRFPLTSERIYDALQREEREGSPAGERHGT